MTKKPKGIKSKTLSNFSINEYNNYTSSLDQLVAITDTLPAQTTKLTGLLTGASNLNSPNIIKWDTSYVTDIENQLLTIMQ